MKLRDQLREMKIINTWDILTKFAVKGKTDVACSFRGPGDSRLCMCAASQVYSPSRNTDPTEAWYNYGRKTFVGKQSESMPLAIAWASKEFGIDEWSTDPTDPRTKIPKSVADAVKEQAFQAFREAAKNL